LVCLYSTMVAIINYDEFWVYFLSVLYSLLCCILMAAVMYGSAAVVICDWVLSAETRSVAWAVQLMYLEYRCIAMVLWCSAGQWKLTGLDLIRTRNRQGRYIKLTGVFIFCALHRLLWGRLQWAGCYDWGCNWHDRTRNGCRNFEVNGLCGEMDVHQRTVLK
jgi:hypothetical protein